MNWKTGFCLCIIAVIIGVVIAGARIVHFEHSPVFQTFGSWRGTTNLPLNKDELLTTQVTLFALFALPSQEAVYLFAQSDSQGEKLNGNNVYSIHGNIRSIKAEYWSITAYGKDLFLIPNSANRYSFNRDNLQTDSSGNFEIKLAANKTAGNWLPVPDRKKFELVLRIYKGDTLFMQHLDKAQLPVIKRI